MSSKAPGKEQPSSPARGGAPAPEDIRTAYEAHTLAQMVYGHLTTTHPWLNAQPGTYGYGYGAASQAPHPAAAQGWIVPWGYSPYGWMR
jgi:hypothetical protein